MSEEQYLRRRKSNLTRQVGYKPNQQMGAGLVDCAEQLSLQSRGLLLGVNSNKDLSYQSKGRL